MLKVLNTAGRTEGLLVVVNLMGEGGIFADDNGTVVALTTDATVWMCRTKGEAEAALRAANIPVTPAVEFEVLDAWLACDLTNDYEELSREHN